MRRDNGICARRFPFSPWHSSKTTRRWFGPFEPHRLGPLSLLRDDDLTRSTQPNKGLPDGKENHPRFELQTLKYFANGETPTCHLYLLANKGRHPPIGAGPN